MSLVNSTSRPECRLAKAMAAPLFAAAFGISGCGDSGPPLVPEASTFERGKIQTALNSPEVEFGSSDCQGIFHPPSPGVSIPPPAQITRREWPDKSTLSLDANVLMVCGTIPSGGGYLLEGNRLTLVFGWKLPPAAPACGACQYKMKYRISKLKQADYEIHFKATKLH